MLLHGLDGMKSASNTPGAGNWRILSPLLWLLFFGNRVAGPMIVLMLPALAAAEVLQPFSSDGCSLFPDGTPADHRLWCECCLEHDMAYWQGGTKEQKRLADERLRSCIEEKSGNAELAQAMYLAVTVGGSPYFPAWYRWGYGWPYGRGYKELTADELRLVAAELTRYRESNGKAPCAASDLKDDETVVFFNTFAVPPQGNELWTVPIHGWVFEPEESVVRKGTFAALVKQKYGLETTPETQDNFDRRVNLFLADNERNKHMVIRLGGRTYEMPPTEPNGHFYGELKLEQATLRALSKEHRLQYSLVLGGNDPRSFHGTVLIPHKQGVSVISDMDDTVKITEVNDSKQMFENTFYKNFVSVPGMAALYQHWTDQGALIHFVTSTPWQLYTPINEFLRGAGFPPATFSMKYVRFKDRTIFNLFKPGNETKPEQIEPILQALPEHRFILVGDSGEQDPEVYAAMGRKYPDRIAKIYIRRLALDAGRDYAAVFSGIPADKWRLFTDPAELQGTAFP
jgi:hypothetical protein